MRGYTLATWVVVVLFLGGCLVTLDYNGAFFDEGIYITAGLRTLEGYGVSDSYLSWFGGSLLWPVLAGLGFRAAGLIGARAVAAVVAAVALAACAGAARNLFGPRVGLLAGLAFAVNGPLLGMARLGVYDALSLAGVGVSFWAITEMNRRDSRFWLTVAAVSFTLAVFAKYPMGLMVVPLVGVILALRRQRGQMDVVIFGFICAAMGLAFFLPVRDQLGSFFAWRLENKPEFGVGLNVIAFVIAYLSLAPLILAVGGWFAAGKRWALGAVLLFSLFIWPAYHLVLRDPVSTNKHLAFGFLMAYPLVGLALDTLWGPGGGPGRRVVGLLRKGVVVVLVLGLGGLGLLQVSQTDRAWADVRQPAAYLVENVQPGDRLLINDSWSYTVYLYSAGAIESPWDVFDVYRINNDESPIGMCEYDWFVDSQGSYAWPAWVVSTIEECGTFQPVLAGVSTVVRPGAGLNYVQYPLEVTIWHNVGAQRDPAE